MPVCALPDRTVIEVSGPEAQHFLQNLVTTNVETLPTGTVSACALLTPQGKVMFDFLVSAQATNCYRLDINTANAADFIKRLTLYKLRAQVTIVTLDQMVTGVAWGSDSAPSGFDSFIDRRFQSEVLRLYGSGDLAPFDMGYDQLRIECGVVESGADYALGDPFGHDISLDQNGGVDFRKGCYVGQEVVSRMHHRKTARRRVVIVTGANLTSGDTLMADGKPAGAIGTAVDGKALAIARLDRLHNADATVNGESVTVALPPNVTYDWPTESDADA